MRTRQSDSITIHQTGFMLMLRCYFESAISVLFCLCLDGCYPQGRR